jgi:nucleoporin NUP82
VMVTNSNTKSLNERVERLRQKVALLGGKELSAKERAFADEVSRLEASLAQGQSQMSDPPSPSPTPAPVTPDKLLHIPNSPPSSPTSNGGSAARRDKKAEGALTARFAEIDDMQENLVKQANRAVQRLNEQEGEERKQAGGGVAAEFRKQRLQQVMAMLERETALVDAVTDRLGRLGVGL